MVTSLVRNAFKYTDSDGVSALLRWVEGDNRQLYIEVQDAGIGLDEDDLSPISDKYHKVEQ